MWVASVSNIDWPNSPSDTVATQKASLEELVDTLSAAGMNQIYFQVRPAGDALFSSSIEPWSKYLTGRQGQPPSPLWDPLEHIIDYGHSKNMEIHAWINPYRASMSPSSDGLAPNHMAILFPEYAYPYSTFLWMDPGAEVVQNRTFQVVMDLVNRYDLDGLHMDDYFYPYPVTGQEFPDNATYSQYVVQGGTLSLDDWRRENVNKLVHRIYQGIHDFSNKPWIRFSVSPFGIYRPCEEGGMPCSINGFDQYSGIYCDAKLWLEQGWVDILQPQLYWKIDPPAQSYPVLLDWWTQRNPQRRHVYAGNYLSRVLDAWPVTELTDQITVSRMPQFRDKGSLGNVQFSAQIFKNNVKNVTSHFVQTVYRYPALVPSYPWLAAKMNQTRATMPAVTISQDGLVSITIDQPSASVIHKLVVHQKIENGSPWQLYKVIQFPKELPKFHVTFRPPVGGKYIAHVQDHIGQESQKVYFEIK